MFKTYYYSDEWNQEEKENLIKKTVYFMEKQNLPDQVIKPHGLLYGEDGICIGYSYRKPVYPTISLKDLFQPENLNKYHIDKQVLLHIAENILILLEELSLAEIYPGFIELSYLHVREDQPEKTVLIYNPEMFQAETMPPSYHWYPSDGKLFEEDFELFDSAHQIIADAKLIYKILTASSKGNAKIPPNQNSQEVSWLFWNRLSRKWKDFFTELDKQQIDYEILRSMLRESFEENLETEGISERKISEDVNYVDEKKENAYALITVLHQAEHTIQDISRELYLLQDKLEIHPYLNFAQGFVLGNKHPFTREFQFYPQGYRSQLGHVISEYSFGEALIIASEMMESALKKEVRPSFLFIILDGEIRNDKIFHIAIKRLEKLTEIWYTRIVLLPADELKGEGYHILKELTRKGYKK